MGVQGLWDLIAPVGRRVSVETLAGKKLAIDASIWIIQFMKAMRDEKGEMVRNAHILGFFRRICKLLYLRTKPVFVFDGGTPALKRRTVIARRRQRENAQAKIRKTAEKLLLNHLKAMRLKEQSVDLENQRKQTDAKGKKVITEATGTMKNMAEGNGLVTENYDKEALDEMLAASIQAEEDGNFAEDASTSCAGASAENDNSDEDEEMILPAMQGKVDPSVLAALPPSMQLDLLGQMRERLMAENRQKYQKVKKAPEKFSELQIQAYLKTVAFRREISEVQKSAAGRGIGGVRTSRIASEANREFIFSSSFTGDKDVLASAGEDQTSKKPSAVQTENNLANAASVAATRKSSSVVESIVTEPERAFNDDVETYLDERGNIRVSRLRAMGVRMTRDLQRNLDLMKEIEEESMTRNKDSSDVPTVSDTAVHSPGNVSDTISHLNSSNPDDDGKACLNNKSKESELRSGTTIQISFEDKFEHDCANDDDDIFARLVAGDPAMEFPMDHSPSKKQSLDSASDVEWEEGVIEEKGDLLSNNSQGEGQAPLDKDGMDDEAEVEWEEGCLDIHEEPSLLPSDSRSAYKGALEEEANYQEAVRRSLEDLRDHRSIDKSHEKEMSKEAIQMVTQGTSIESVGQENYCRNTHENLQQKDLSPAIQTADLHGTVHEMDIAGSNNCLGTHLGEQFQASSGDRNMQIENATSHADRNLQIEEATSDTDRNYCDIHMEPTIPLDGSEVDMIKKKIADTTVEVSSNVRSASHVTSIEQSTFNDLPNESTSDAQQYESEAASHHYTHESTELTKAFSEGFITDIDSAQNLDEEGACDGPLFGGRDLLGNLDSAGRKEDQKVMMASLEEEMHVLDKEREKLGDEQRKLERNAESVSSEMFAECQELLQMFGLPYIIAPMEAEAQCAYMELTNLVDGVVTDDSDAFLFGARSVYKNIFDDRKYVETYFMKDVENELGLDREKIIRMALLLGSDYTEGVSGIGIVNAIEVVNAFPEEDGLQKFREWVESPDPSILGGLDAQAGSSSRKRGCKVGDPDMSCSTSNLEGNTASDENVHRSEDRADKLKQIFMNKHRNISKNWHIPSSFPSSAVISAYVSPRVDKSTEPFAWGKPDVSVLRKVCWEKFGWSSQKADELLLPVLKEYNKHETQLRLEAFYSFNERFAKIRSKRIKKAVKYMTGNKSSDLMHGSVRDAPGSSKKRVVKSNDMNEEKIEDPLRGPDYEETETKRSSVGKKSRKRKGEHLQPEHLEPPDGEGSKRNTSKKSCGSIGGRQKTARSVGKASKKSCSRSSKTSSEGETDSDIEQQSQIEKLEKPNQARRSERHRKIVNYSDLRDDESDEADKDNGDSATEKLERRESGADVGIAECYPADSSKMNENDASNDYSPQELSNLETGGTERESTVQPSFLETYDPVPGDVLSEEYLKMGGGFCLEEDDGDMEHETKASKEEYLKMGGGFCSEEDDRDMAHETKATSPILSVECSDIYSSSHLLGDENCGNASNQLISSPSKKTSEKQCEAGIGASEIDQDLNNTTNTTCRKVSLHQENMENNDYASSSVFLRAMPNLRKRKKNS
ncbi:DNA repair protein UVH3 isoform X1 [Lycium ferocissimum]|uniref:DNA repair protein UVH3 isoform X1 n=1 Tax=Lycium ferocissimum TaxID=112874 RepID=UPI00281582E1|nr:DNA repair protein UVH3 isoform X1 [Lycium ferocissimum]